MKDFRSADEVLARAVDLMSRREHGTVELRRKLRRKGAPSDWTEVAIERLRSNGLLDDERAAQELARWYFAGGSRGRRKVGQLLQQRGFSGAIMENALATAWEELGLDEQSLVDERLLARFPMAREKGLTAKERAKARRFLLGKGYDPPSIYRALDGCPRVREDEAAPPPWASEETT